MERPIGRFWRDPALMQDPLFCARRKIWARAIAI